MHGQCEVFRVRIASEVSPKTNRRTDARSLESIPTALAARPSPYPPFPLSIRLFRQFGAGRTLVRYLVVSGPLRTTAASRHAERNHRGTLRCDEGRRERSPDPSTRQRLGGVQESVNPFFAV